MVAIAKEVELVLLLVTSKVISSFVFMQVEGVQIILVVVLGNLLYGTRVL